MRRRTYRNSPVRHGSRRHRKSGATRPRDWILTAGLFIALGALAVHFETRPGHQISGTGRVVDGDTLAIGADRIRLEGMDAPEIGQTCRAAAGAFDCGAKARETLVRAIGNGVIVCDARRKDRYGRFVATCRRGDIDLGRLMVEEGWAVASDGYDLAERQARNGARGIWAGEFERPRDWRAQRGLAGDDGGLLEALMGRLRILLG